MKKRGLSLLLAILMVVTVFSPALGIIASAADGDIVELAFNNLFVLESWASNSLSSAVRGTAPGTLETDLSAGSFTLTKTDTTQGEVYTAFAMGTGDSAAANFSYWMAEVEGSSTYKFAYNLAGTVTAFTPFVFMYDGNGEYQTMAFAQTTTLGDNSFEFTTNADTAYIQVRFTINETAAAVSATVSDIVISKIDITYGIENLFKFDSWADSSSNGVSAFYPHGTVNADTTNKSISIETSTSGANLFTAFSIDAAAGSNDSYYSIDVKPNTSYTLFYTLSNDSTIQNFIPYIARYNSDNGCIDYFALASATHYGESSAVFTTTADTEYISVVFSITHNNQVWTTTVSNIGVYETEITDNRMDPHRLTYTEGSGTYGELPTPTNIPEGKHFAGWYTGKNGSGEAITADTEISYKSHTVYPYYQTKVDSLSIKSLPTKTAYTLGEKVNTAGLILTATQTYTVDITDENGNVTGTETKTNTFDITSGYTIEPEYVTATGTQAITVSYGGQTATFNVEVSEYIEKTISVDDADLVAQVANNVYTLNYTAPEAFSRYELTYYSDSYVKGTITMADGTYEDFFLEPSTKGSFASYIDDYLTGGTYADIKSIGFESLNKEFGNFELYSVETIYVEAPADTMAYYENADYKAGINLAWGGVLAYLQDLNQTNPVMSATYSDGITKVNYSSQLPSGSTSTSNAVNLINTYDKGRYVQQSYYGTREEPYVLGDYNGVEWNYNPVQGGNLLGEASKVVDYRITDTEIYVKTRPLEWAKWSDEAGAAYNATQPDDSLDKELIYEDSYNAWAYMESWYVFEDGMLKTYCRYVDYSGYPSATTTQEFPAFYCVEPLNNFVYYAGGEAWDDATNTVQWESDLDFWGASTEYNEMLIANGLEAVDPYFDCNENWAAFMGGTSNEDFGIGIYTADVTNFVAGSFMSKYQENQTTLIAQETSLRHADTTDPATENPTSYISPIDTMEMESYKEYTYSYYITTGTQEEIREDFRMAKAKDEAEAAAGTRIAVPETVYMQPVGTPDATTTVGQYYVNNVLDANNYYSIETVAQSEDKMSFSIYSVDAKQYKVSVTNVTTPSDDIILGNADGTGNVEGTWFTVGETDYDTQDELYGLRFASTGLKPGEIATAKWEITVEYEDGTTKTHTAYTVLYAPELTVGAVAEGRYDSAANTEISSWITGANGVDHSQRAPLGSFHGDYYDSGYFKLDPLAYPDTLPTGGTSESEDDYIYTTNENGVTTDGTSVEYTDYSYVMQTATNGSDGSRSQSYLGLLTVDKSRYTNTNQIPNLKMGYDVLRVGSNETDSLGTYTTYYTLGTADSYTSTSLSDAPSGWTVDFTGTEIAKDNASFTDRRTVVPSYSVSDIDGKYIHAVNQAMTESMNILDWVSSTYQRYATAGTSVLCSVTDKSGLRDSVLQGYNISRDDYSEDSYNKMVEKLQPAATVLGDPSATQEEIDNAQKELDETLDALTNVFYSLKYDNIFSAYEFSQKMGSMTASQADYATVGYEDGVITVVNEAMTAGETYSKYGSSDDYYKVTLQPNTEYVFEYDVTTTEKAQAFMFFYDASGANGDVPTNMSIKTNNGSWGTKSESNPWFGNYTNSAGTYHYAIKFTTGANTTQASFRFGNTSSNAVTSSFSNIKLVTSDKYYEGAIYSATEAVYKENDSYGTLATVTNRPGYTFTGWKDAGGNTVTGATLATNNLSVYSQWDETVYTVVYDKNGDDVTGSADAKQTDYFTSFALPDNFSRDYYKFRGWAFSADATTPVFTPGQTVKLSDFPADKISSDNSVTLYAVWERGYSLYFSSNGGTGEISGSFMGYTQPHSIPENTTITRYGYTFLGWSLDSNATAASYVAGDTLTVSEIDSSYIQTDTTDANEKFVVLHAVWAKIGPLNVTFDNLVDISAWSTTVNNGTPVNKTDTGFTVKSNDGVGEATCSSAYFTIEAGHKYVVNVDIKGDGWDVYFFFCDANGNWVDFADSTNRFASNGLNVSKVDGINYTSVEFTAPAGSVKAQLRVDANGSNNAVRYENIRVYDVTNTTYLNTVNKYVEYGEAYGELPVPVKEGSQFLGWVDGNGNTVTADSIMESTTTVYLTSTWTVNPNTANDDTVVIEYGCPVIIDVLANDETGTVSGIGTKGVSDSNLGSVSHPTNALTDKADSLTLDVGDVKLNADGTITFTPSNTNVSEEIVFYYELTVNGAYYYAKVTIIPATTIYFEDTFFVFTDSTVTKDGKTYNYNWQNLGTSVGEVFQSADRPGAFNFEDDANNVYGYDPMNDSQVSYSGGTAHFTEVDQIAGTSAPTATFTFTGTGFDLFSVTDSKSGTITVTIYEGTDTSKRVQGIMSNAYFGYTYDSDSDSFVTTDNGALFQVPLIRARDLSYGTYTVVVQPRYNWAFDVARTYKSGVYVDSVRIYDPMGDSNTTANDAYKADGEYAPQYLEIRDTLVASNGDGSFTVSDLGIGKSVFLDGGRTSMDDFADLGPKNEVYLQNGNSVAFHIVTDRADLPSTIQLGMKLTGKGGSTATVNLMNSDYNGWSEEFTLNSTAERYYNIEAVVDWVEQADGTYKTASPVIVTNTSDAIISLTSLKWAFDSEENAVTALNLMSDADTPELAKAAVMRMSAPQVTTQQTILSKDNISYEFSAESYAPGETGTLTITTEQGVEGVTVNATDVLDCVTNEDGKLEWTFEFTAESADSMTFEIIARDENGIMSEAVYASTAIENETTGDSGNDATEPDDEVSDDTTVDSGLGDIIDVGSFVTNIINGIFEILEKVFGLFLGGVTA